MVKTYSVPLMACQSIKIHFPYRERTCHSVTMRKYKMYIKGKACCDQGSAFGCESSELVVASISATSCLLLRCPVSLSKYPAIKGPTLFSPCRAWSAPCIKVTSESLHSVLADLFFERRRAYGLDTPRKLRPDQKGGKKGIQKKWHLRLCTYAVQNKCSGMFSGNNLFG